mgnify:CR=1 FL=1
MRTSEKTSSSYTPKKPKKKQVKKEKSKVKLEEKTEAMEDESGVVQMQFGEEDCRLGQNYTFYQALSFDGDLSSWDTSVTSRIAL